jgi:hypothetical protein
LRSRVARSSVRARLRRAFTASTDTPRRSASCRGGRLS